MEPPEEEDDEGGLDDDPCARHSHVMLDDEIDDWDELEGMHEQDVALELGFSHVIPLGQYPAQI